MPCSAPPPRYTRTLRERAPKWPRRVVGRRARVWVDVPRPFQRHDPGVSQGVAGPRGGKGQRSTSRSTPTGGPGVPHRTGHRAQRAPRGPGRHSRRWGGAWCTPWLWQCARVCGYACRIWGMPRYVSPCVRGVCGRACRGRGVPCYTCPCVHGACGRARHGREHQRQRAPSGWPCLETPPSGLRRRGAPCAGKPQGSVTGGE